MTEPSDLWPPFGLTLRSGDLTLSAVTDDDLPGLVDLVRSGIHEPDVMPFNTSWTRVAPEEVAQRFAAHHWSERAAFGPDHVSVDLAVRVGGELVGTQGFAGGSFAVTRTAETGSWLARKHQGRGIGTRMRQAVCTLLLDHLGAAEVTSTAFVDNPRSLGVSRKVGYRTGDVVRTAREGRLALSQRLSLRSEDLVRGEPVEVTGAEPLQRFLGLDGPPQEAGSA